QLLMFNDPERVSEIIEAGLLRAPNDPLVHLARSQQALTERDTKEALSAARTAIELNGNLSSAWMQVGRVNQARIREARLIDEVVPDVSIFEAAIAAFEKAQALDDRYVGALVERARVYGTWPGHENETEQAYREAVEFAEKQGNTDAIVATADAARNFAARTKRIPFWRWSLRKMVDYDDSLLENWGTLATLFESRLGEGEEVMLELVKERPDDPQAHMLYANFLVKFGRSADAVAYLLDVLESGLDSPLAWEVALRIQLNRRQLADARATFVRMSNEAPDSPITERAKARIALAERRTSVAHEILRSLVGTNESYETQRLLAVTEHRLGNLPAAVAAIDRALAMRGDFVSEGYRLKAAIHHDAKDWGVALRVLRALIGRGVTLSSEERLMRARCLYRTRQHPRGREVLEQLLAESEPLPEAAVLYAQYEAGRHPERTLLHLSAALERRPRNFDVLEALGSLDIRAGRVQEALDRLNQVIATRRAGPKILLLRANLLARTGDLDRAETDALRAFEAAPRLPGAVDLLFAIYREQGRLLDAQRSFEEAEAAGVLHAGARQLLARLYIVHGDVDKAMATLEKVVEDNPDMAEPKNDLAYLLAEEGTDLERALRLAKDAQGTLDDSPGAADTVGYVYYRKGLYAAALQQFRFAVELQRNGSEDASEPDIHYHLGLTLYAMGRNRQAEQALQTALGLDSEFAGADDARRLLEAVRTSNSADASRS
ncbi:MAG: tetratricopeptide repeat protein, partial [Myxococcota bacterium]